jgi:hypothetical protein
MPDSPDFRLDGLTPADFTAAEAVDSLSLSFDTLATLAQHHTDDHARSFYVLHDTSATWSASPGTPQLVALDIARDPDAGTFRIDRSAQPTAPFAQRWLINRGCPSDAIQLRQDMDIEPADELTTRIEEQIRTSGDRYEVTDHYTHDGASYEAWVMVHDQDHGSAELPVRLFLEEADLGDFTYTLREGAFADTAGAQAWLADRDTPLPAPRAADVTRSEAALARTTATYPAAPATSAPPSVAPAAAPSRLRGGRS